MVEPNGQQSRTFFASRRQKNDWLGTVFGAVLFLGMAVVNLCVQTPSPRALGLVCMLLAASALFPVLHLAGWAKRRKQLGIDRVLAGVCPWCGYDVRTHSGRCPECGWRVVDPNEPLARPLPAPASTPLLWSARTGARLYVTWTLAARPAFSPARRPADALRDVAAFIADECGLSGDYDGFLPQDLWGLMVLDRHHLRARLDVFLGVRLSHAAYADLGRLTFEQVVDLLIEKGAKGTPLSQAQLDRRARQRASREREGTA